MLQSMTVVDTAWQQVAPMGKIVYDSYIEEIEFRSLYYAPFDVFGIGWQLIAQ